MFKKVVTTYRDLILIIRIYNDGQGKNFIKRNQICF